jgi:hypothetical protein
MKVSAQQGAPVDVKKLRSFLATLFAAPEPKRSMLTKIKEPAHRECLING